MAYQDLNRERTPRFIVYTRIIYTLLFKISFYWRFTL